VSEHGSLPTAKEADHHYIGERMSSQKQAKRNDASYQIRRWRIAHDNSPPESLKLDRKRQRPLKSILSPNHLSLDESGSSI